MELPNRLMKSQRCGKHSRQNKGKKIVFPLLIRMNYNDKQSITITEEIMLKIYTIQISMAKKLNLFADPRFLDITVKSGDKAFAPTWKMVMASKEQSISDEEYEKLYILMMRESHRKNKKRWDEVLSMDQIIFACYCKADSFCHRYLLKDIFVKLGADYTGEIRTHDDIAC